MASRMNGHETGFADISVNGGECYAETMEKSPVISTDVL